MGSLRPAATKTLPWDRGWAFFFYNHSRHQLHSGLVCSTQYSFSRHLSQHRVVHPTSGTHHDFEPTYVSGYSHIVKRISSHIPSPSIGLGPGDSQDPCTVTDE